MFDSDDITWLNIGLFFVRVYPGHKKSSPNWAWLLACINIKCFIIGKLIIWFAENMDVERSGRCKCLDVKEVIEVYNLTSICHCQNWLEWKPALFASFS